MKVKSTEILESSLSSQTLPRTRRMKRNRTVRSFILMIVLALVVIAAVVWLNKEAILMAVGDFLIVQDKLEPADVIHVISGEEYRTEYGIQLYQQGYGKELFFTGGWCQQHQYYHGQHSKELAIELGVPSSAIATDDTEIHSTYEEAERLKAFIIESPMPIRSVIIVSDPYHMWRARWTYRKVLGSGVKLIMAPVPFEDTFYQRRWWTDWETSNMVRDEYEKIIYYFARYQIGWGPLQNWLATFDTQ